MLCRSDQYLMTSKELQPGSIRVRLAVLGSFGNWAVRHGRLKKNITLLAKRSGITRRSWLRGLDLNQRPLASEFIPARETSRDQMRKSEKIGAFAA